MKPTVKPPALSPLPARSSRGPPCRGTRWASSFLLLMGFLMSAGTSDSHLPKPGLLESWTPRSVAFLFALGPPGSPLQIPVPPPALAPCRSIRLCPRHNLLPLTSLVCWTMFRPSSSPSTQTTSKVSRLPRPPSEHQSHLAKAYVTRRCPSLCISKNKNRAPSPRLWSPSSIPLPRNEDPRSDPGHPAHPLNTKPGNFTSSSLSDPLLLASAIPNELHALPCSLQELPNGLLSSRCGQGGFCLFFFF